MRLLAFALALAACSSERAPAKPPPAAADAALVKAPPSPRQAIERAIAWLAAFPDEELRYDAAVGLTAIRRRIDDPRLQTTIADRDPDNPMRRAFEPAYQAGREAVLGWTEGAKRINPNRVVVEALHCDVHGIRPETVTYATGAMRDDGGYHTTHAVWALVIAERRGCVDRALLRPLLDELRAAQPAVPGPAPLDVDLFAERLLMLLLAGDRDAAIDGWARALIDRQAPDGGFGAADPPYVGFHATMMATWALVVWEVPEEPPSLEQLRDHGLGGAADAIARRAAQEEPKMRLDAAQALAATRALLAFADEPDIRALHQVMPRSTVELARAHAERDVPLDDVLAIARYLVRVVEALDFERLATFDENHSHVTGRRWPEIDYSGEDMTWQGQEAYWAPRGVPDFRSATAIHAYFTGAEKLSHWRKVYRPRGTMAGVTP